MPVTMKQMLLCMTLALLPVASALAQDQAQEEPAQQQEAKPEAATAQPDEDGWIRLFDGETFGDWRRNENEESWTIQDGCLVAKGDRSHLFYMGREFKSFEFKADVMTQPGSNSGIYFHTKFQRRGWPEHGYECQVNVTHTDPVKTGSIYNTKKLLETPAEDNKWWTQHIIVQGNKITVKIDGETVLEYEEPADKEGTVKLSEGLFALQAHDPQSVVRFRNLMAKPLP
jgi:hypothetical protein